MQKIDFNDIMIIIEILGAAAFAASGCLIAIKHNQDILGVIILGVVTATGGGVIRDIIIGITPPIMFVEPIYALMATFVSILIFILHKYSSKTDSFLNYSPYAQDIFNICDALGLGAFTVVGMNSAISLGYIENTFLVIFLGVITGVGGGLLRDIMAGDVPAIFRKHVYATASIIGAVAYYICYLYLNSTISAIITIIIVLLIRILAKHYNWHLPRA